MVLATFPSLLCLIDGELRIIPLTGIIYFIRIPRSSRLGTYYRFEFKESLRGTGPAHQFTSSLVSFDLRLNLQRIFAGNFNALAILLTDVSLD